MYADNNNGNEVLKNILLGSTMGEVSYNETFSLIFNKSVKDESSGFFKNRRLMLIIDSSCWFGEKEQWNSLVSKYHELNRIKGNDYVFEMEDSILAYGLIKLRSGNLTEVDNVEFNNDFLQIHFESGDLLTIENSSESDYSWVLEDIEENDNQKRMSVFYQGCEIIMKNIPDIFNG